MFFTNVILDTQEVNTLPPFMVGAIPTSWDYKNKIFHAIVITSDVKQQLVNQLLVFKAGTG